MYTLVTEVEHEETNRWFELEIDFDYDYPEHFFCQNQWHDIPGQIYPIKVKVLDAILYDTDGEEAVRIKRTDMHPLTIDVLDGQMYDYVDNEIDTWGSIADEMVAEVEA